MHAESPESLLAQLETLRHELIEQAFALDREGHLAAADVAMITAARLAELRTKFSSAVDRAFLTPPQDRFSPVR